MVDSVCPACGSDALEGFHTQGAVPANSCLLLTSREEAAAFPVGSLHLAFCTACGFVTNTQFDPTLAEYSDRYEETQGFSERFVSFARSLAHKWVADHDLAGKTVLEIGCGKGEFLVMMAEAGIGHGIGIDPGVHPERIETTVGDRLEWIADFYSDDYAHLEADAIVCRHTLEHIGPVGAFVGMIRRAIGDRLDTRVLFEVPDTQRVLDEVAFWDVYYEHCSYFSAGSLARLFERHGFEVLDLTLAYDDQYLICEARPVGAGETPRPWVADDLEALRAGVDHFRRAYAETLGVWEDRLGILRKGGGTAVIWGAGSKGVSFLSVVGDNVSAAVDINPYKHGMYMAGTGHPIISPGELRAIEPDLVIAMNPVYLDEIRRDLDLLGIGATLVAL